MNKYFFPRSNIFFSPLKFFHASGKSKIQFTNSGGDEIISLALPSNEIRFTFAGELRLSFTKHADFQYKNTEGQKQYRKRLFRILLLVHACFHNGV